MWTSLALLPAVFAPFDSSLFQAIDRCQDKEVFMDQMKQLIEDISKKFGINPLWISAIILHESSANRYQIRYEPNYKYLLNPQLFADHLHITLQTEIESQKISWGLGQIMGALAREQGHIGLMAELVEPELNIKHMCIRIQALGKYSANRDAIFSMYNGGPGILAKFKEQKYFNQHYVDKINKNLKNLSAQVEVK